MYSLMVKQGPADPPDVVKCLLELVLNDEFDFRLGSSGVRHHMVEACNRSSLLIIIIWFHHLRKEGRKCFI